MHVYILGEINVFANSTRGDTTMGARGRGARVGVRSPPPPKNQENFVPVIWGNFCFILHVGAFLLHFSHYSFALAGGGGNRRQLPPLKKSAIWGAFLLPFLYVGAFLLLFLIIILRPLRGRGQDLAFVPP